MNSRQTTSLLDAVSDAESSGISLNVEQRLALTVVAQAVCDLDMLRRFGLITGDSVTDDWPKTKTGRERKFWYWYDGSHKAHDLVEFFRDGRLDSLMEVASIEWDGRVVDGAAIRRAKGL